MNLKKIFLVGVFSQALIGCGGGSNSQPTPVVTEPEEEVTIAVEGTLVVPEVFESLEVSVKSRKGAFSRKQADGECENVPAGYFPLANQGFIFVDMNGSTLSNSNTDSCGFFQEDAPEDAASIRLTADGYRDLVADIEVFKEAEGGVASTISINSEYEISSIQISGDNGEGVSFSIVDTSTKKAVIGIPKSAVSASIDDLSVSVDSLGSAQQTKEPASVTIVLDASGSMSDDVYDEDYRALRDENGNRYTLFRLAALAAHTYLNNMPTTDETGIVLFSSDVFNMNDETIANTLNLEDHHGAPVSYEFSETGFTSSAKDLRFVIDAYNRESQLYSEWNDDPLHEDTPEILSNTYYPYGGGTSLFDGIGVALDNTSTAGKNNRKIVIAMSDGYDNNSSYSGQDIIEKAVDLAIPVYTIAFGGADPGIMENIATSTNASFFNIDNTELSGIFQTIQTGIIFQYVAGLSEPVGLGEELALSVELNGLYVSRSIIR